MKSDSQALLRARIVAVVAGLAVLSVIAIWIVRESARKRARAEYYRVASPQFGIALKSLSDRAPPDVEHLKWDQAIQLIYQLSYNCRLADSEREIEIMDSVCSDLKKQLDSNVGPETLTWMWKRLAQTGEWASWYAQRHELEFKDAVKACVDSRATPISER